MKKFSLKIKGKLLLATLSVIFSLFTVITLIFIFSINAMSNNDLKIYREEEVFKRKNVMQEHTEIIFNVMEDIYKKGINNNENIEEIKNQVKSVVKQVRYDYGVGYFWINDTSKPVPVMIMHPTDPSLDGKVMDDSKYDCAYGGKINIFSAFVDVSLKNGSGFVDYLWPKPTKEGLTEEQPKISYVRLFEPFRWVIGTGLYIDDIDKAIAERKQATKDFIKKMLIGVLLVSAVLMFVAAIIMIVFSNNISKRLLKVVNLAGKIADGELDINKIAFKSNDELGMLVNTFNRMIDSLKYKLTIVNRIAEGAGDFTVEVKLASNRDIFGKTIAKMLRSLNDILGQVDLAISNIALGSNQVAQASQVLSQGATEQAGSLEEITSSIMEISTQVKQNADNAKQASDLAEQSMDNADKGNKEMTELVAAMEEINKSAGMIKKIVKIIDDIAFQTNLLALNANVEAARAGKYGKGFAVVAEEVRSLAGRSAESVEETTQMVEETIQSIEAGNNLVNITAKQFEDIITSAGKVVELVGAIAIASNDQTNGLDQINQGLGQIDQVTQSNTASAEESASASEELASQAQQLKAIISRFKLVRNEPIENQEKGHIRILKDNVNKEIKFTDKKKIVDKNEMEEGNERGDYLRRLDKLNKNIKEMKFKRKVDVDIDYRRIEKSDDADTGRRI